MNKIILSYIITTKNKLPFLTYSLNRLIANICSDEEIVVIDGDSTDGSKPFLAGLLREGKIHQFISEPDCCEAHGLNKGILLAKGELIKIITDDDSFNYLAIHECKKFMVEHRNIDVIIGNVINTSIDNVNKIEYEKQTENDYQKWLSTGKCFPFTGLSLMIRKQSIALTGLFSCYTFYLDTEYSLRITSMANIKIAWSNAILVCRIENTNSTLLTSGIEKQLSDVDRFLYLFDSHYRMKKNKIIFIAISSFKSKLKRIMKGIVNNWKSYFPSYMVEDTTRANIDISNKSISEANKKCEEFISRNDKTNSIISP